ncbi:cytosolic leucyl tRNA synthetase [Gonapodya sp. JEL0774]|nr:cytosolic leucyl tRNA synthetase [Gonapodya sp. JEL0774]
MYRPSGFRPSFLPSSSDNRHSSSPSLATSPSSSLQSTPQLTPAQQRLSSYARLNSFSDSTPREDSLVNSKRQREDDDNDADADFDGDGFSLPIDSQTTGYLDWSSIEASSMDQHISETNIGYRLATKMGWKMGESLGKDNQGIKEPIRISVKDDPYGLGKISELHDLLDASTAQRRLLESEAMINETEEQREERESKAHRAASIRREVNTINRVFRCDLCDKQYTKVSEYDNHLSSYDHHHRKRMKELKEVEAKNRNIQAAEDRKKREERDKLREQRELAKLLKAGGGKTSQVIGSAPMPPPPQEPAATTELTPPPPPPPDEGEITLPPPPPPAIVPPSSIQTLVPQRSAFGSEGGRELQRAGEDMQTRGRWASSAPIGGGGGWTVGAGVGGGWVASGVEQTSIQSFGPGAEWKRVDHSSPNPGGWTTGRDDTGGKSTLETSGAVKPSGNLGSFDSSRERSSGRGSAGGSLGSRWPPPSPPVAPSTTAGKVSAPPAQRKGVWSAGDSDEEGAEGSTTTGRGEVTVPPFGRGSSAQPHSKARFISFPTTSKGIAAQGIGFGGVREVSTAMESKEVKSTVKRDTLVALEKDAQQYWDEIRAFEVDPPNAGEADPDKFFTTFPYPYMNGRLHLGHSFSMSKCEFVVGYQRMKGKKALWPFGFHVTGMPIRASADKIAREVEKFGPMFEKYIDESDDTTKDSANAPKQKSKVAAKTGGLNYQFQILREMGVPLEEIHKFSDPLHWLDFFPPLAIDDLKALGMKNDWRRTFLTTEANPYYDSFVRWQFNKLYHSPTPRVKYGERYTIFSPLDGQPCMDHDRASGEGVGVQEYTGIKIKVLFDKLAESTDEVKGNRVGAKILQAHQAGPLKDRNLFLVAATLRPETMYGQTNCFVSPDITYGVFEVGDDEAWIVSNRSARNMAFQALLKKPRGEIKKIMDVGGWDLVGVPVKAPLSKFDHVYLLPMEGILETKGTGVVTSVPSDSPDDYITLMDLAKKPAFYHVDADKWVKPFLPPLPLIRLPTWGDIGAVKAVEHFKVKSQKDKKELAEAKEALYKEGFYQGIMIYGPYSGKPVQEAKPLVRSDLINAGDAIVYCEPENRVVSRSGDECVASLVDQWYMDYGDEEWTALAKKCLSQMNTYGSETRNGFEKTLEWLHEWACSRTYGLGTKLPWDTKWLIESLSDSTIYMAYYTVCHHLHADIRGREVGPLGIRPEEMTDEVWEYVLIDNAKTPEFSKVPLERLNKMKKEFQYWYPMDLRCSGKDLIPNHLSFSIYNHVTIFPESRWPKAFRANGHLLLNGDKMSKSTGNFMTLRDATREFGADATRLALADSGDTMDDANFVSTTANAAILRLFTQKEFCEEVAEQARQGNLRTGPFNFADKVFESDINKAVSSTQKNYEQMLFREALLTGFYELQNARDAYREYLKTSGVSPDTRAEGPGMHIDLAMRFIEVQALLVAPIIPHWSEHIWRKVLHKDGTVTAAAFPAAGPIDESAVLAMENIRRVISDIRREEENLAKKKAKGKPVPKSESGTKAGTIFVAAHFPTWQTQSVEALREVYDEANGTFVNDKEVLQAKGLLKDARVMKFVGTFKKLIVEQGVRGFDRELKFNELATVSDNSEYIRRSLGLESLKIVRAEDVVASADATAEEKKKAELAEPGNPTYLAR